jgi:hypothetical protein
LFSRSIIHISTTLVCILSLLTALITLPRSFRITYLS